MAKKALQNDDSKVAITVERGSGNAYRDLGFPNPEETAIKSDLVSHLGQIIRHRGLAQTEAGHLAGVDPTELPRILRGHFHDVPFDDIFSMLVKLGEDISITVHTKPVSEQRIAALFVAFR